MILIFSVVLFPEGSLAVVVTFVVPAAVGVPDIAPVLELMLNPAGRLVAEYAKVAWVEDVPTIRIRDDLPVKRLVESVELSATGPTAKFSMMDFTAYPSVTLTKAWQVNA